MAARQMAAGGLRGRTDPLKHTEEPEEGAGREEETQSSSLKQQLPSRLQGHRESPRQYRQGRGGGKELKGKARTERGPEDRPGRPRGCETERAHPARPQSP